jgi:hypothetical protein
MRKLLLTGWLRKTCTEGLWVALDSIDIGNR